MSYLKFIFSLGLIYLSFIGWSGNNWLFLWFLMEISFMFFVGVTVVDLNLGVVELMMKYFITQVFISLIFSALIVFCLFNLSYCLNLGLVIVLCMKLGMFPFHFWIVSVLGKLSWLSFFFMLTFVKLLPILLLYYLSGFINFSFILFVSVMIGSILGLGNLMVQKLMAYSSLVHLCWLLLSLMISLKIFFIYFFCYLIMMAGIAYFFQLMNVYYINQFKMIGSGSVLKMLIFFFILSFAGFPPFMGFILKWLVLSLMFIYNMKILFFLLVMFSLFSVLFYLELFYYFMMMSSMKFNWYGYSSRIFFKSFALVLSFYFFVYFFV